MDASGQISGDGTLAPSAGASFLCETSSQGRLNVVIELWQLRYTNWLGSGFVCLDLQMRFTPVLGSLWKPWESFCTCATFFFCFCCVTFVLVQSAQKNQEMAFSKRGWETHFAQCSEKTWHLAAQLQPKTDQPRQCRKTRTTTKSQKVTGPGRGCWLGIFKRQGLHQKTPQPFWSSNSLFSF